MIRRGEKNKAMEGKRHISNDSLVRVGLPSSIIDASQSSDGSNTAKLVADIWRGELNQPADKWSRFFGLLQFFPLTETNKRDDYEDGKTN